MSAATLRGALYPYYSKYFGSNISVTLVMFDKAKKETTDIKKRYKSVYTIKLLKMINGVTANNIIISKKGTRSNISARAAKVRSSLPLSGNYIIACKDSKGVEWKTDEIPTNAHYSQIQNAILNKIPHLTERVQVMTTKTHGYTQNGVEFLMYFSGLNSDPEQCTIEKGRKK